MLSYRRETALHAVYVSFGQKWKTGTGRQYFKTLIGLSSTIVTQSFPESSNSVKKNAKYGYYATQGHSRSVSELSQLIVQISDTAFLSTPWGLRDNVRCSSWAHWKARSGARIKTSHVPLLISAPNFD